MKEIGQTDRNQTIYTTLNRLIVLGSLIEKGLTVCEPVLGLTVRDGEDHASEWLIVMFGSVLFLLRYHIEGRDSGLEKSGHFRIVLGFGRLEEVRLRRKRN